MTALTYDDALAWIHSKLAFGIKPGLERMTWMLEQLGNPQNKLAAVHVVGTNGKGSTVNYLQKIFTRAGYEVGTFTSPYIMDFKERISLNGQMMSEQDFLNVVMAVMPVVERLPLETTLEPATEFEVITLMMFYYFGEMHPVDIAFIEAGLGGLYDSTNVFRPLALVIPSIGLDHQAILGQTYEAIAQQKIGALKPAVPLIYASDRLDVTTVFEERAQALKSPSFALGREFDYTKKGESFAFHLTAKGLEQYGFGYDSESFKNLQTPMPGEHQLANSSLALMTCLLLMEKYPKLIAQSIKEGLTQSIWLGRTEFMAPNLMIDGAHNLESIAALVAVLKHNYSNRRIHLLFAAIDTKPVIGMLQELSGFNSLMVTTFDYPNSLPLDKYPSNYDRIGSFEEWRTQIYEAESSDLFVVTGSLYFISQVRQSLLQEN